MTKKILPDFLKKQTVLANHQIVRILRCKRVEGFIKVKLVLKGYEQTEFPHGTTWLSLKQLDDAAQERVMDFIAHNGFDDGTQK